MNKKLKAIILVVSICIILNLIFSNTVKILASTIDTAAAGKVNVSTGDTITLTAADYTHNANVFCDSPSTSFVRFIYIFSW